MWLPATNLSQCSVGLLFVEQEGCTHAIYSVSFRPGAGAQGGVWPALSFVAFAVANIAIDIEGRRITCCAATRRCIVWRIAGSAQLAAGDAVVAAVVAAASWRDACGVATAGAGCTALRNATPARAGLARADAGLLSHIALDSLMHADVWRPFAPFAADNPWLGLMSEQLPGCVSWRVLPLRQSSFCAGIRLGRRGMVRARRARRQGCSRTARQQHPDNPDVVSANPQAHPKGTQHD